MRRGPCSGPSRSISRCRIRAKRPGTRSSDDSAAARSGPRATCPPVQASMMAVETYLSAREVPSSVHLAQGVLVPSYRRLLNLSVLAVVVDQVAASDPRVPFQLEMHVGDHVQDLGSAE